MSYDYRKFSFTNNNVSITLVKETFTRTDSGLSWRSKPDTTTTETVDARQYTNYITSIPWFNNFGYGCYCRAHWNYTKAGYLPTEVVSVSPHREKKIVAKFHFN